MTNSAYYAVGTAGSAIGSVIYCLTHHSSWDWTRSIFAIAFTLLVMTALRGVLNPKKIRP